MDQAIQDLNKDVIELKTDLAQIDVLVEKLDVTIDKLSEVSQHISELIAVHGSRLENQERLTAEIFNLIERRTSEANENLRYLKSELIETEKQINSFVDEEMEKFRFAQMEFVKNCEKKYDAVSEKIKIFDKWIWVVTGILMAILVFTHGDLSPLKYFK